ncbi:MAG: hypothetical protein ACQKBY_06510, partial [Verrucomicrobiales bacterium]
MKAVSTFLGIGASGLVLVVLVLARLLVPAAEIPTVELQEIQMAPPEEPPPPPPEETPPDAPPPPPALTQISEMPDPTRVPMPKAQLPMDIKTPVDPFFTDIAPAPLPEKPKPVVKKSPPKVAKAKPTPKPKARPRPKPPAPAKSHYNVSELDGKPRLIRAGRTSFPSSLARRGVTRGTAVLEVELSTSGRVRVRRVISCPYPELAAAARRDRKSTR